MSVNVKNLSVEIEGKEILHNVDIEFTEGKRTAIIGPNGAGKSTLLRVLAKFNTSYAGQILMDGEDIRDISKKNMPGDWPCSHRDFLHLLMLR